MHKEIVFLRGPDRIRLRPAVIFGSDDLDGVQQAVLAVLQLFAAQAQLGYCKHLQIRHNGAEVTIRADDPGLYLGQDTGNDGAWQDLFCVPEPMPRSITDDPSYQFPLIHDIGNIFGNVQTPPATHLPQGMGAFDLCALQCASRFLDVTVVKDGIQSTLHFRQGHNVGGIRHESTDAPNGTALHFAMDPEVFRETVLPAAFFREGLTDLAMVCAGLRCSYIPEGCDREEVFFYPGGLADYARSCCENPAVPIYHRKLNACGRERYNRPEYDASVEIAIAFCQDGGLRRHLHNFRRLSQGGIHCRQIQRQLCRAIQIVFGVSIRASVLQQHLAIFTATRCPTVATVWENGTRQAIENKLIADMAFDATGSSLITFLLMHKKALLPLVNTMAGKKV